MHRTEKRTFSRGCEEVGQRRRNLLAWSTEEKRGQFGGPEGQGKGERYKNALRTHVGNRADLRGKAVSGGLVSAKKSKLATPYRFVQKLQNVSSILMDMHNSLLGP